jgi:predicted dehydrogenase
MSTTVADAAAMIAACKAANVKLMIAYRCHYEPTNLKAVQLITDGAIGQVQAIESSFGFNIGLGEWRLNKKLAGGGPVFDVGIYSLNACRYLTREEPVQIAAFSSVTDRDGRFDQVEENVSWTMRFPSGVVASCATTYGAGMPGYFKVYGSPIFRATFKMENSPELPAKKACATCATSPKSTAPPASRSSLLSPGNTTNTLSVP